ncbi:DEAD/DEAH box helicase [bacterium SCSIO 12696]|nr:DEAD/DEAH box helicase [bacterium SCSIO 12696]
MSSDSQPQQAPLFADLGLADTTLKALKDVGYEQPSPIQAQSIPILLSGANLLGTAQTGTGKTAAFALPLLNRIDSAQKSPQILVLAPTRELAIQVAEAFKGYARYIKGFQVLPIYGGQDMGSQLRALKRGVQVVVGTPGRIMDHLRRRSLNLSQLKAVVLDEADEMLRMGFIDDVDEILSHTPDDAQRALFSATMPGAIRNIVGKYLGDAQEVKIAAKTTTVERIEQRYLVVHNNQKLDAFTRILEVENFDGMIVFVRTKQATVELAEKLEARGYAAGALNGDLSQQLRERTIDRLKKGQLDIVVATDVAARGLDVERISHVFNYDIPYDTEAYVHRIGRTGRAGRDGVAILFVNPRERRMLQSIERTTRQKLAELRLPTGKEVGEQRVAQFKNRIRDTIEAEQLEPYVELLQEFANGSELSMTEIAASLAFQAQKERPLFPKFAEPDTRPRDPKDRRRPELPGFEAEPLADYPDVDMVRYRLAVGRKDGVMPKDVVGCIANEADIDSKYIGRIQLYDVFTVVDLPAGMPKELLRELQKARICQKPIKIRQWTDAPPPNKGGKPKGGQGKPGQSKKGPRKRKPKS